MSETATHDGREMAAGRELDALVAERVMGFVWHDEWRGSVGRYLASPDGILAGWMREDGGVTAHLDGIVRSPVLPPYSTDMASAWLVVDAVCAHDFHAVVKTPFVPGEEYHAGFTPQGVTGWNGRADHRGSGDTPALAICRAALAAIAAHA